MGKVIIIGSSSSVLTEQIGTIIDDYETVCRFNRAPTVGYEKYIGSKTTHRFCNLHVAQNDFFKGQDMGFIPALRDQIILTDKPDPRIDPRSIFHESCRIEVINRKKEFLDGISLIQDITNLNISTSINPSSGLGVIFYFINKGEIPDIHGFDVNSEDPNSSPHYWWKKTSIGGSHNFGTEREILREMNRCGKINII